MGNNYPTPVIVNVGADLRVCPNEMGEHGSIKLTAGRGSPLQNLLKTV